MSKMTEAMRDIKAFRIGDRVESGYNFEDYDTGRIVEITRTDDWKNDPVTVAWNSGVRTTQARILLRHEGQEVYGPEGRLHNEGFDPREWNKRRY